MRTKHRAARLAWAGWMLAVAGCGTSTAADASLADVAPASDTASQDAADTGFADAIADAIDAAVGQDVVEVASASDAADASGAAAYPAGPYGTAVGQVLANLNWVGYVNSDGAMVSSALPYGPTSLDALRQGHHYGLIHISEFY
ncbi:MAG: hypothetical protein WCJ30_12855 [Deltaproteobacteria bacterium]